MDSTERSVIDLEQDTQAKLAECRRIREWAAANPEETGYAAVLVECDTLERSVAARADRPDIERS